jgi:hypothetical protein
MRYQIRLGRWKPLLALFGATPKRSYVDMRLRALRIRFGPFMELIPIDEIASAGLTRWPVLGGIGWRIGPDYVGLIGSLQGVVELTLHSRRRAVVLFLPWRYTRMSISFEEPEAFLAELRKRQGQNHAPP